MRHDLSRLDLVDAAREVAESYRGDGYDMTLRQLYYQLVAKGLIPNLQESYKRLGDALGNARLAGEFDFDLLVDRGREAGASKHVKAVIDVDAALIEAGRYVAAVPHWTIEVDRWFGQPIYVSVWVEKEALSGVFEKPCEELGVGFFACKGYPSHSALWQWIQHVREATIASERVYTDVDLPLNGSRSIERIVVLYFGDHDPDGWQIPRSAEETVRRIADVQGIDLPDLEFRRVALNMRQIEKFKPPPFPAKPSSSRFAGYIKEHGVTDAWELDALPPDVLDELIRWNVGQLFDHGLVARWAEVVRSRQSDLIGRMVEPGWIDGALGVGGME